MLEITGLRTALFGPVDLSVAAGETLCLSGASGAGKSVLLRALADLDPHEGEMRLDGTAATALRPAQWRSRVGLLPAESQWWADRVGDHFGAWPRDEAACLGFPPEVREWSVARCSTGERQRLALLRLLANRPRVLLLDEPTASLDPDSTTQVEGLVRHYRDQNGAAVVWVSHDPRQIERIADRHLRIRDGAVVEESP